MFRHQSNFYLLAFLFQYWLQEKMPNTLTELLQDDEDLRKMFPILWNVFKEPSVNHACQPLLCADGMAPLSRFLTVIVGCWTWFPARKERVSLLWFSSLLLFMVPHFFIHTSLKSLPHSTALIPAERGAHPSTSKFYKGHTCTQPSLSAPEKSSVGTGIKL